MSQFEEFEPGRPAECAVCEAMCPDAVDGTLSEAEQRAFDKHVAGCVMCAKELAEARRGAAWLTMLKGHAPEPSAALLQRILAETTGATIAPHVEARQATPAFVAMPAESPRASLGSHISGGLAAFQRKLVGAFSFEGASTVFHPRMAMTAAMAFFSIALTLNMTGVRWSDISRGITQPTSLRRSVADAGAKAERSFQNLRVVYAVESRVSDLRNNGGFGNDGLGESATPGALDSSGASSSTPAQQTQPQPDSGNSDSTPDKKPVPHGSSELQYPVEPVGPKETEFRKGV